MMCTLAFGVALACAPSASALPFLPSPGDIASDAFDAASRAIVNMISGAVAALTNEIIKAADTLAAPQLGSSNSWFTASYKRVMGVSLWLMAIIALISMVSSGIRGKPGEMVSVLVVRVPGAIIAMMLATWAVQLSLALTDAMTAYVFRGSVDQLQQFLHDIGAAFVNYDGAGGDDAATLAPGLVLIIGLLLIVLQLVVLAVLVVRSALVYIVTLFLPLALAVQVWPSLKHMNRKAIELLAVVIFSKFAIFASMALGAGAMSSATSGHASASGPAPIQSAIVGVGVMAVAAFAPMLLMSIIPGIAGSFAAGVPGGYGSHSATGAVRSHAQIMRSTLSAARTVRGGKSRPGGSGQSGQGSSGQSRQRAPQPPTGGASGRGGGAGGSHVAREQAHAGAAGAGAGAAAASVAAPLAVGAVQAASTAQRTLSSSAKTQVGAASQTASSGGERGRGHAGSGRAEDDRQLPERSGRSSQLQLPIDGASATRDGFTVIRSPEASSSLEAR